MFNLPKDSLPSSFQAPLPVPTEVTSIRSGVGPVKEGKVCWILFIGEPVRVRAGGGGTHNEPTTLVIDIFLQ